MIQFQFESWDQFHSDPETDPLLQEHSRELSVETGEPRAMELNIPVYEEMDRNGILVILTVREDCKLVGYCLALICRDLHYPIVTGFSDLYYLTPSLRGRSIGRELIETMTKELAKRGATRQFWGVKEEQVGLFEALWMEKHELVYRH